MVVIISGLGWYYRDGLKIITDTIISPYEPVLQKVKTSPSPKPVPPPEWKKINISSLGLTLNIPPDWVFDKDAAVIKSSSGRNVISISANSGILVPDVFNQDLFRKIYNLKVGDEFTETQLDEEVKFKKIDSGKILTGQPYAIFVWAQSNSQTALTLVEVRAFILKDTTLIIFKLNKSSDERIEFLKKIVTFSSLN